MSGDRQRSDFVEITDSIVVKGIRGYVQRHTLFRISEIRSVTYLPGRNKSNPPRLHISFFHGEPEGFKGEDMLAMYQKLKATLIAGQEES